MNCIICGKEFESRYGGKTCSRKCTARYSAKVRAGEIEGSVEKYQRTESAAMKIEQGAARRVNMFLLMPGRKSA